jgi:glycosyltransferase involved in cell wall biosynthesis
MFSHFPSNYKLKILAVSTHEDAALIKDAEGYGADLKLVQSTGTRMFAYEVFKELQRHRYDLILSQGFISAVSAYMANLFFRIPHILTIHSIVEPQYLSGRFCVIKRLILARILSGMSVLYAVSNDILEHLYEQFPSLKNNGPRAIVINNGIEPAEFEQLPSVLVNLREKLGVDGSTFLFGFFGRFMPQKGFDLLIDAVATICKQDTGRIFSVVAVGSGDYQREYQAVIRKKGLEEYFHFLPFQSQVFQLYPQVDVIVMPSRWEASGLLAMEALCMGTPLIASGCIGLRETITDTPAMVFSSENVNALAEVMFGCLQNNHSEVFQKFVPKARALFDVTKSAQELVEFIEKMQDWK